MADRPKDSRAHLTEAQLREEYAWFRARERRRHAGDEDSRDTGNSSDAMVSYALGESTDLCSPGDLADLVACYRCREGAPAHLHAKMDEVLPVYTDLVVKSEEERALPFKGYADREAARKGSTPESIYEAASAEHYQTCRAIKTQKLAEVGWDAWKKWMESPALPRVPTPPPSPPTTVEIDDHERVRLSKMNWSRRLLEVENIAFFHALRAGADTTRIRAAKCDGCSGKAFFEGRACAKCRGYGCVVETAEVTRA